MENVAGKTTAIVQVVTADERGKHLCSAGTLCEHADRVERACLLDEMGTVTGLLHKVLTRLVNGLHPVGQCAAGSHFEINLVCHE
jgi:hypothetical protein